MMKQMEESTSHASEKTIKTEETSESSPIPRHIRSAAFKCEFCEREFHLKDQLIRHVISFHRVSENAVKSEDIHSFSYDSITENQSKTIFDNPTTYQRDRKRNQTKFERDANRKSFTDRIYLKRHELFDYKATFLQFMWKVVQNTGKIEETPDQS
eukprot:773580_1